MSQTISELAKAKSAADEAYGKAFREHLRIFKPLEIDQFWQIITQFRTKLDSSGFRGSSPDVKSACHNMMCLFVYGSSSTEEFNFFEWPVQRMDRWENMARFLARYEEVSATLSKKCFDFKGMDRGDDSYGDLMDSLPLAGKEVFDAIMSDDIANGKQLDAALKDHSLEKFILDGENYICMTFEKALRKAYVGITEPDDDHPELQPEEDPHIVLVTEPQVNDYVNKGKHHTVGLTVRVYGPFHDEFKASEFVADRNGGTVAKLFKGRIKR